MGSFFAPPKLTAIHDIVMQQGGGVNKLHSGGQGNVII
jgi:hypothetical protein